MVKFLSIPKKVELQPHWSFGYVCKVAIKVEKHSKNKMGFTSSYSRSSPQIKSQHLPKAEAASKDSKGPDKGKKVPKSCLRNFIAKDF